MRKEVLEAYYIQHHRLENRLGFSPIEAERGRYFRDWIGQGKRVLDLGCRDGTLTQHYATSNQITGVDVDRQALEICANRLQIETQWVNLNEPLPFDNAMFDVVVAGEVLEHLVFPHAVVAEVSRVLVPNGFFVGSVPNAFRLKNRLLFLAGREFEVDETHLQHFPISSLQGLLSKHFRDAIVLPRGSRFLRLSPSLFGHLLLWKCVK